MPLPDLSEIEVRRKRLGISQAELAEAAGIARSSLTKIEQGYKQPRKGRPGYVPNFEDARALIEVLEKREEVASKGATIDSIMTEAVVTVPENKPVPEVKKLMLAEAISQIPIISSSGKATSLITEVSILGNPNAKVAEDAETYDFAVVGPDRQVSELTGVIKGLSAILVVEDGKLVGICTKSDFLK